MCERKVKTDIILANLWYPPHSGFGGVAVYNYYLAHALVKLGHKVTVIAARRSSDVPVLYNDNGVEVHRLLLKNYYYLHRLPLIGRYVRFIQHFLYARRIALKLLQIEKPDIIEFAEINAESFFYLQNPSRAKVVVRCHTPTFVLHNYYLSTEMTYNTTLISAMEKSCIRRADTLTAPSKNMSDVIAEKCNISAQTIKVIPNALDVDLFAKKSSDNQIKLTNNVVILHVGRLDRTKGVEVLAHAIPRVLKALSNISFVFVGPDRPNGKGSTWQQRLEQYFESKGVSEQVIFTGEVDQNTLINWYHKSDIAVVPSMLYESFSYTCAQAMAAGLPVVATRIGGIPETLDIMKTGIIVSPGDVEELTQALLSLIENRDLRKSLGSAGHKKAKQCFDAKIVAQQAGELYESIMG